MILDVQNLQFRYPHHPVLKNATFRVESGQLLAVLGTNGTGKSTLLKCINRVLEPQGGSVLLGAEALANLSRNALARRVGYVEQQRSSSRTTVFNAVLLGRKPYIQWDIGPKDMEIAAQALETLGMGAYALRFLDELSGGELQKVAIARALAQQPKLLLLDEPTSSLDLKNQLEVLRLIRAITHQHGTTTVVAIHDLNLALRFADRFILLKDGVIFAAGGTEVLSPANIEAVYAVPVALAQHNGRQVIVPL